MQKSVNDVIIKTPAPPGRPGFSYSAPPSLLSVSLLPGASPQACGAASQLLSYELQWTIEPAR